MTALIVDEAARMQQVPAIVFADSVSSGRVARVAATGLEVWEIVSGYRDMGEDVDALRQCVHWLLPEQLHAVLTYYEAFPQEIDEVVDENDRALERVKQRSEAGRAHQRKALAAGAVTVAVLPA